MSGKLLLKDKHQQPIYQLYLHVPKESTIHNPRGHFTSAPHQNAGQIHLKRTSEPLKRKESRNELQPAATCGPNYLFQTIYNISRYDFTET